MAALEGASGACDNVVFGTSSTFLKPTDAAFMGCTNTPMGQGSSDQATDTENPEMPFLKKWVRTRHAILFRLSNRTVQVLFFDRRYVYCTIF
jgi:hypothetical protein